MNICVPVADDRGMKSCLSAHVGSAPLFLIVDTERGSCRAVPNLNLERTHGMCQPLLSLAGERIDALVVGGIGRGALAKLQAADVRVYLAEARTAEEVVRALRDGSLAEVTSDSCCTHQGLASHPDHRHGAQPQGSCCDK